MEKRTYLFLIKIKPILFSALFTFCVCTYAQLAAEFIAREPSFSAWVNVVFPHEGEYVYVMQEKEHMDRQETRAFVLGQVPRQNFDFFSAQEEEALWLVREEQLASMHAKEIKRRSKQRPIKHKKVDFHWPKVIVKNTQVCVPKLEHADVKDWREHLLCWPIDDGHTESTGKKSL